MPVAGNEFFAAFTNLLLWSVNFGLAKLYSFKKPEILLPEVMLVSWFGSFCAHSPGHQSFSNHWE
jgi:hypothetical protein